MLPILIIITAIYLEIDRKNWMETKRQTTLLEWYEGGND